MPKSKPTLEQAMADAGIPIATLGGILDVEETRTRLKKLGLLDRKLTARNWVQKNLKTGHCYVVRGSCKDSPGRIKCVYGPATATSCDNWIKRGCDKITHKC